MKKISNLVVEYSFSMNRKSTNLYNRPKNKKKNETGRSVKTNVWPYESNFDSQQRWKGYAAESITELFLNAT